MRGLVRVAFAALLVGCGGGSYVDGSDASAPAPETPLSVARTLARPQRTIAHVLEARRALVPEGKGLGVLPATPGDLALHVASRASEPTRIGTDEEHSLSLSIEGATGTAAQADEGAAIHRDVFPSADALWATTEARAELLFLLHDASAPTHYAIHLDWGSGLRAPFAERGGYSFRDDRGNVRLHVEKPLAVDANGVSRFAAMSVSADGHTLTLDLDTAGLTYPILLDPAVAQGRWTKIVDRNRAARATFSWDTNRSKLIGFGGYIASPTTGMNPGKVSDATFEYVAGTGAFNALAAGPIGFTSAMFGGTPTFYTVGYVGAFDTARKKLVAIGGLQYDCSTGCTALNRMEVFEWDSVTNAWAQRCTTGGCPANAPPIGTPAPNLEAVYDEARAVTLVCNLASKACATWNGATGAWATITAFPAASVSRGYYDPTYGAVTFLGSDGTYSWSGSAWVKRVAGTVGTVLGVTYDTLRKRAVALSGNGLSSDTYEWNGSAATWTLVVPASDSSAPPNKVSTAIGYDRVNGRVVVYGGGIGQTDLYTVDMVTGVYEYKAYGNTCAGDADCYGGSCRDGFCCDTKCGACRRCDGPGAGGVCAVVAGVAGGGTEHDTCTGINACDPGGACKLKNGQKCTTGTECASGSCTEGLCCNTSCGQACETCTVTPGTCTPSPKGSGGRVSCGAGLCDGVTRVCSTACTGDADCSASGWCGASTCVGTLAQGTACLRDRQCTSGSCRDGFCCSADCSGACETCAKAKGASADGTCSPLPATTTPLACGGYACSGTSGACAKACATDAACGPGYYCDGALCQKARGLGEGCAKTTQCATGLSCADGVCCNSACDGTCQACSAANKASGDASGVCGPARIGSDPGDRCPKEDSTTCGKSGVCGAGGTCAVYVKGAACGSGVVCEGGLAKGRTCDGLGACVSDTVGASCVPGVCSTTAGCTFTCTTDAECDATGYCQDGTCKARAALGRTCTADKQCGSGFCVDGVCCANACKGVCEACNGVGTEGTCTAAAGTPREGHGACPTAGSGDACTAAACDGTTRDACKAFAGPEVTCRKASCADGVETLTTTCDGTGACPKGATKACAPFGCAGVRCATSCGADTDCSKGNRCDLTTGKCVSTGACDGDHTIVGADGSKTECAPFKCDPSGCKSSCTSSDECAPPALCDGSKCVLFAAGGTDDSGGCASTPRRTGGSLFGVALFMMLAGARRRSTRKETR